MSEVTMKLPFPFPITGEIQHCHISLRFPILNEYMPDDCEVTSYNATIHVGRAEAEIAVIDILIGLEIPEDELAELADKDFSTFASMAGEFDAHLSSIENDLDQAIETINLLKGKLR